MSQTAAEHWLSIVQAKAIQLEKTAAELLAEVGTRENATRDDTIDKLVIQLGEKSRELAGFYAPGLVPEALISFRDALKIWDGSRGNLNSLLRLIRCYERLDEITTYSDHTAVSSFDSILQRYRDDEALEASLTELVDKLRELVRVADEALTAQLVRELREILRELEHRQKKNLTDLVAWLDFAMKGFARFTDLNIGGPYASLAYDCAKLALDSRLKIRAIFDRAQREFRLEIGLPFFQKAAEELPDFKKEADLMKYLPQSQSGTS
jgi:hypothetical protein